MRRLALNLLTVSGTAVLLVLLTLPALRATTQRVAAVVPPDGRLFGVYVDPWHIDGWTERVGARPNLVAKFEAFSRRRSADKFLRRLERDGVMRAMVSWEPWKPVPARLGARRQAQAQPGYTNAAIAAGAQDAYIAQFARSLARFDGVVYLRYAHEMNGFWYPWSADARAYVRAWRHVVRIVRAQGRGNVRFVWSVNPNLYETRRVWLHGVRRYWPGARYVDLVGSTMIDFGGAKDYTVDRFEPRLIALHRAFRRPLLLTEVNTQHAGRVRWLRDLRSLLQRRPFVRGLAWSQLPSRGQAQRGGLVGDVSWDVTDDGAAAAVLREIALDDSR
ncbi:MAG TPA: glycosyl hydrolase [Thermoleophilaceae bacterium]